MEQVKPYKKNEEYSYTLGAFPTIELLKSRPELCREVILHSTFEDSELIQTLCEEHKIPFGISDKQIARLSDKENCFVVGVFRKYQDRLDAKKPHIVLVNPSNMGNMGTILRTAVGMGFYDLAIISPSVDSFHPKTVRASMGALFRLRHCYYNSFAEYQKQYPEHLSYCFMLNGEKQLSVDEVTLPKLYSLVFGNEATGLPKEFLSVGTSILIPQSKDVDSLNLTIAAGIAMFVMSPLKCS